MGDIHWRTIAIITVCLVWSAVMPLVAFRSSRWLGSSMSGVFLVGTIGLAPGLGLRTCLLWWLAVMFAATAFRTRVPPDAIGAVALVGTLISLLMLWTNDGRSLWTIVAYGVGILVVAWLWQNRTTIVHWFESMDRHPATPMGLSAPLPPVAEARDREPQARDRERRVFGPLPSGATADEPPLPEWTELPPADPSTDMTDIERNVTWAATIVDKRLELTAIHQHDRVSLVRAQRCSACGTTWTTVHFHRDDKDFTVGVSPRARCAGQHQIGPALTEAASKYIAEELTRAGRSAVPPPHAPDAYSDVADLVDAPSVAIRGVITHGVSTTLITMGMPPGLSHVAGKIVSYACRPPFVRTLSRAAMFLRAEGIAMCVIGGSDVAHSKSARSLADDGIAELSKDILSRGRPERIPLDEPAPPEHPTIRPPRPPSPGDGLRIRRKTL